MTAFIGLGGNLGDPRKNLSAAVSHLAELFKIESKSSLYRTAPVGGPAGQPVCYNAVAQVKTVGGPKDTMNALRSVERKLGRIKAEKWGPRIIDLDLLDQDGIIIEDEGLILPHPMLHLRSFVLLPLGEIAPDWVHPRLNMTTTEMVGKLSPEDKAIILGVDGWPE